MFRMILVATDGSWPGERAARAAVSLAEGEGAHVVVLSVARPYPPKATGRETAAELEAAVACAHQEAIRHVNRVASVAHEAGVPCRTVTAVSAFPGDEIIHAAERNACDLIVLGSHGGRSGLPLLGGSVCQQVLAYSPVPVLVLRDAGAPDHAL